MADAHDSKSCGGNTMRVRFSPCPPSSFTMKNVKIGEGFLEYYRSKGFEILESAPMVHPSFPMTFNMSAGLLQLDPLLKGKEKIVNPKMAVLQNCFRHFDLDKIGDPHHLSFFKMAGAFELVKFEPQSILERIWQFLTEELGIDKNRVWVTVFQGEETHGHLFEKDEESLKFWRDHLPGERIILYGSDHNFWQQAGGFEDTGGVKLCGPSTEVFYDLGGGVGCQQKDCRPGCPCGRFLEISNNLFIRHSFDAQKQELSLLAVPAVETVIGVERVAAVVEGKPSVYETVYYAPLMRLVLGMAKARMSEDEKIKNARIVCDHTKALLFLFSEGAPSPGRRDGGRPRIVLKLVRGLLTKLILLRIDSSEILPKLMDAVVAIYPENPKLQESKDKALEIIYEHEKVYRKTLERAQRRIAGYLKKAGRKEPTAEDREYFREYFGIPLELQDFYQI